MTLKTLGMGVVKFLKTKGRKVTDPAIKTKGRKVTDPAIRKGIASGLKEHRASKSYKMYKKTMQKIPHDLTYMKGQLKD